MAAFLAVPGDDWTCAAGVILLPDNRGVTPFYERLAEHLASEGYPTLAIDYFARPEIQSAPPPANPQEMMQRIADLTRDGCYTQVSAAAGHLRECSLNRNAKVLALGFCMGARIAFLASQPHFGFAGVAGLYGSLGPILDAPGPQQLADRLCAPILGIFGGADPHIPPDQISAFDDALTKAGVSHEFRVYPGAPHSFFDIAYEEHKEICVDAWQRILAFLRAHS
jgi:carboxymethylenebutenolidase